MALSAMATIIAVVASRLFGLIRRMRRGPETVLQRC